MPECPYCHKPLCLIPSPLGEGVRHTFLRHEDREDGKTCRGGINEVFAKAYPHDTTDEVMSRDTLESFENFFKK